MTRRKTYRRLARQRWPGSRVFGAGPWAVVEAWPGTRSGLAVTLSYSETRAREMAEMIGHAYEFEYGDASPVPVYDLTPWRSESRRSREHGSLHPPAPHKEAGRMLSHRMRQTP